jgi:hypothetical protein
MDYMSLRHQWRIADPSNIENDINKTKEMLGIFGKDHQRFKKNIDSRNFGEECFEFDMSLNNIKRFEQGWKWEDFVGQVGSYQRFGLDPFEYHIPNAVAFTHDPKFYKPDYSVLYWKRNKNGSLSLINKLVEVKGSRNIKNQDYDIYRDYQRYVVDPHNQKVKDYAKDHFVPKCLIEFELFIYPTAYASGLNAQDPSYWTPTIGLTEKLEVWSIDELEVAWNNTKRDFKDPYKKMDTKSIFNPAKVNAIDGVENWSDEHYKKAIHRDALNY